MYVLMKHPNHTLTSISKRSDPSFPTLVRAGYVVLFENISRKVVELEQVKKSRELCEPLIVNPN